MTFEEAIEAFDERQTKDILINLIKSSYTLVMWPKSQDFMKEDWFEDEAVLNLDEAAAYFIPNYRIFNSF